MNLNLLVATSQINSNNGKSFGTGNTTALLQLARNLRECDFQGNLYVLPFGSRNSNIASPFSQNNGFALTIDELDYFAIPELAFLPGLKKDLEVIHNASEKYTRNNRTVSYTFKRSLASWIINRCFDIFPEKCSSERKVKYEDFQSTASYWLDDYALFEIYKEIEVDLSLPDLKDKNSQEAKTILENHAERYEYHKYLQFLCFEQRQQLHKSINELGIGLILNLPFGVEFKSADVFFHPEVFENDYQVGCSPEPEHGYPEQAWGVAVYKERSSGLQKYLSEKMNWLAKMGDGVFLDHLVGWCGQYVVPLKIPDDSQYPHGHFLTEDHEIRKENITWFLNIIRESGMEVRGEVAGDAGRVKATSEVIEEMVDKGDTISAMAIPRWNSRNHKLLPLKEYKTSTLMMVETHDTSTLLQYLLNQKGYADDFETPDRILEFCHRVLALPLFLEDIPLKLYRCDNSFWLEIFKRICHGSKAENIVFTLPGLISLLSSQYRSPSIENNINVKPGTSGKIGNGWRNWSYFSPPIEAIVEDQEVTKALQSTSELTFRPFDWFHKLDLPVEQNELLDVYYSRPAGRSIIYKTEKNTWDLLQNMFQSEIDQIDLEMIIKNTGEEEIWQRFDVSHVLDLEIDDVYNFQDLNNKQECYTYYSKDLSENLFFVRLLPGQIHHFLVSKGKYQIKIIF